MQKVAAVEIEKSFSLRRRKTYGQSFHQYSSMKNLRAHFQLTKTVFLKILPQKLASRL